MLLTLVFTYPWKSINIVSEVYNFSSLRNSQLDPLKGNVKEPNYILGVIIKSSLWVCFVEIPIITSDCIKNCQMWGFSYQDWNKSWTHKNSKSLRHFSVTQDPNFSSTWTIHPAIIYKPMKMPPLPWNMP